MSPGYEDECGNCGTALAGIRRRPWERLWYSAIYWCPRCAEKTYVPKFRVPAKLSAHRCCPKCGFDGLTREHGRDPGASLYLNPISLLQALFGAPSYTCPWCRLQFYDFRPGFRSGEPQQRRKLPQAEEAAVRRDLEALGKALGEAQGPVSRDSEAKPAARKADS